MSHHKRAAEFEDSFEGHTSDPAKWVAPVGTIVEDHKLTLPVTPTKHSLVSLPALDLTLNSIHAKLDVHNIVQGTASWGVTQVDSTNELCFQVDASELKCTMISNGEWTTVEYEYYPTEYAFLRIRERAGWAFWEVSADGESWRVLRQSPHNIDTSNVKITFDTYVAFTSGFGTGPFGLTMFGGGS